MYQNYQRLVRDSLRADTATMTAATATAATPLVIRSDMLGCAIRRAGELLLLTREELRIVVNNIDNGCIGEEQSFFEKVRGTHLKTIAGLEEFLRAVRVDNQRAEIKLLLAKQADALAALLAKHAAESQ